MRGCRALQHGSPAVEGLTIQNPSALFDSIGVSFGRRRQPVELGGVIGLGRLASHLETSLNMREKYNDEYKIQYIMK